MESVTTFYKGGVMSSSGVPQYKLCHYSSWIFLETLKKMVTKLRVTESKSKSVSGNLVHYIFLEIRVIGELFK